MTKERCSKFAFYSLGMSPMTVMLVFAIDRGSPWTCPAYMRRKSSNTNMHLQNNEKLLKNCKVSAKPAEWRFLNTSNNGNTLVLWMTLGRDTEGSFAASLLFLVYLFSCIFAELSELLCSCLYLRHNRWVAKETSIGHCYVTGLAHSTWEKSWQQHNKQRQMQLEEGAG